MYVCVCNAVTERHINEAVRNGVTTMRELRKDLGVTAECGRCAVCARDCLRAAMAEQAPDYGMPASVLPSFPLAVEAS